MNNFEKLLVQIVATGAVVREEQWFKSKGITVQIELKDIDYDYIDKAIAEMNDPEDESQGKDNVDSSELREFFDAKFGGESND